MKLATFWAAQKIVNPTIGGILKNPLGWMSDEYGGSLDGYAGHRSHSRSHFNGAALTGPEKSRKPK